MSDEYERSPAGRREQVREALERHGVAAGQAAALAKSLLDLVTVIGEDGCRAAFAAALGTSAAAPASPARDGAEAAAAGDAETLSRLLGSFAGELRRLDDALQLLARQLARAAVGPAPKDPGALH